MFERIRGESGFTPVELLVVLVILAILITVVVPNFTGFLERCKESAFNADRSIIQAAVNAYYTDSVVGNNWPTLGGLIGAIPTSTTIFIEMDDLITYSFLRDVPVSAGTLNGGTGSYIWYVDANGIVQAWNSDLSQGYNGNYP